MKTNPGRHVKSRVKQLAVGDRVQIIKLPEGMEQFAVVGDRLRIMATDISCKGVKTYFCVGLTGMRAWFGYGEIEKVEEE